MGAPPLMSHVKMIFAFSSCAAKAF